MADVISKGVRINYTDTGKGGQTYLLMPAWCMSRSIYDDLVPLLAEKNRVLAMDWRGHGESDKPRDDFGAAELIDDAIAVIEASGAEQVIPVSSSHAGWVNISIRKRLGESRIPKLVFVDWLVLPPAPEFVQLVSGLATADAWEKTRGILFDIWLTGVTDKREIDFVRGEMGSYGADMWMRSGREIGGCYQQFGGYPLAYMSTLDPPAPMLHVYSQPRDEGYHKSQIEFASKNPWYRVVRLEAKSHFPTFESSPQIAKAIMSFS